MAPFEPSVETSTCSRRIKHHILRRDADRFRGRAAGQFGRLCRDPQFELAVIVPRGRAGGFDRGMDGRGHAVGLRIVRALQLAIGIALFVHTLGGDLVERVIERFQRRRAFHCGGTDEARFHRAERTLGDPPALGHCGEIAFRSHHTNQPFQTGNRLGIEGRQFGLAQRPVADRGVDHARQPDVASEQERAIDLRWQVEPGKLGCQFGLGGRGIFCRRFHAHGGGFGRFEACRFLGQFAEAEPLLAVSHLTRRDFAFLPVDPPALGSRHRQHGPGPGRGFAQRRFISGQRSSIGSDAESVVAREPFGEQAIGIVCQCRDVRPKRRPFGRQRDIGVKPGGRRRFDRDLPPVGAEFDCHHLGQHRGDALPHFELGNCHGHHPVAADCQPAAKALFARRWSQGAGIAARP